MTEKEFCSGLTENEIKSNIPQTAGLPSEVPACGGPSVSVSSLRPHFLFNALASIRELALTDPEEASDMIYAFAVHLRADINAASSDREIPFSLELKSVRAYLSLEQMRFGDKLKAVYDIGPADFTVPPLSIRRLAEKAVRGFGSQGGTVTIRTADSEEYIKVEIIDAETGGSLAACGETGAGTATTLCFKKNRGTENENYCN